MKNGGIILLLLLSLLIPQVVAAVPHGETNGFALESNLVEIKINPKEEVAFCATAYSAGTKYESESSIEIFSVAPDPERSIKHINSINPTPTIYATYENRRGAGLSTGIP